MAARLYSVDDVLEMIGDLDNDVVNEYIFDGSDDEVSNIDSDNEVDHDNLTSCMYDAENGSGPSGVNNDEAHAVMTRPFHSQSTLSHSNVTNEEVSGGSNQNSLPWFDAIEDANPGDGYLRQYRNVTAENIQWNIEKNPPVIVKSFKGYSKPYGPTFIAPTSIHGIFLLLFTTELMTTIVTETNRYASLCLKKNYATWDKITMEELSAYFGYMILMGMVNLPSIKDYWKKHEAFHYRPLANGVARSRFLQIHRFLHFVNNDSLLSYGDTGYSNIQKVKPILTQLAEKCRELFTPGRDLAVDEAMVKFKGRSSIKQYMPKKPIKRGFKIWILADSESGYVLNFNVYEGKKGSTVEKGLGASVVLTLTEQVQKRYHHVFF